jgi:hypothetical protein
MDTFRDVYFKVFGAGFGGWRGCGYWFFAPGWGKWMQWKVPDFLEYSGRINADYSARERKNVQIEKPKFCIDSLETTLFMGDTYPPDLQIFPYLSMVFG